MKLTEENTRSYIDDIRYVELLKFLTWKGDLSPTWIGKYMPATHSDDEDLVSCARFNRDHYLFYRALIEYGMDKRGLVLDLGCGTGQRTALLSRYSEDVLGLDIDMLKVGAAANLNASGNIAWACGDIRNKTVQANVFDYIFCVEVIEHIELTEQASFIRAMLKVLNPGSKIFLTTPSDKIIERRPPHIGLWDETIANNLKTIFKAELRYYNVKQLVDGGEDPWCDNETRTHYVMIVEAE